MFDVNFFGVVHGYQAALPHLKESQRHVPACQLGPCVSRHPAAGGVLRVEGGRPDVPRVGTRRAAEARRRRSTSRSSSRARSTRLSSTARGSASASSRNRCRRSTSPSRSRRRCSTAASTRFASSPWLGRAEAPLGPEALAARRRLDAAAHAAGRASTRASRSPSDSPDNLFEPLPGDPGAHGRFDGQARELDALDVAAPAALARGRDRGRRGRCRGRSGARTHSLD